MTQTITITIQGTDDVAEISGDIEGSVTEDSGLVAGNLVVGGQLTLEDVDTVKDHFNAQTVVGDYGTLTLGANGAWSYVADNSQDDIQHLGADDSLTDTLEITSADGVTQTITITIQGTDDVAEISGDIEGSVTEDSGPVAGNLVVGGQLTLEDVDTVKDHFNAQTVVGDYGTLTLGANGAWSYVADNSQDDIQHLGADDSLTDTLEITSADGVTQTITITIQGTDDVAEISGDIEGSVTEDSGLVAGNLVVGGQLTLEDVDTVKDHFNAQTVVGDYGTLTLGANGAWSYVADNSQDDIQHLGADDSLTDTLEITSADGVTQTITITIQGTDDVAEISGDIEGSVTEDSGLVAGNLVVGGQLTLEDVDTVKDHFNAQTVVGDYGTLTLGANGAWSYVADNSQDDIQHLGADVA